MNHVGEACALVSAIIWAVAVILFKRAGEKLAPIALNFFKCCVALVLFGATLAAHEVLVAFGGGPAWLPAELRAERSWIPMQTGAYELGMLMISGVLGLAVADSAFFAALNRCGVGLLSVVDTCYTPLTIFFAWALLDERLTGVQFLGVGLIVFGVLLASRHAPPVGRTRLDVIVGVALGVLAMGLMAFSIVMIKPILQRWDVIPAVCVRMLAGVFALGVVVAASRDRSAIAALFRRSAGWKSTLGGSVLGTYLSLIFWVAGFKYTAQAAVAAVLNQTTIIFQLILATFVLREPFTRRKLAAIAMAASGVVLVNFGSEIWRRLTAGAG